MENILSNHWNILLQDPHLKTILPTRPRVTYCKAPNLKNKIAPSKFKYTIISPSLPVLVPLVGGHVPMSQSTVQNL